MLYPIRIRAGAVIVENGKLLLAEFNDENGLHYNLPAGGVEEGESIREAVVREVLEETGADVSVGELAFSYEYAPHLNAKMYGDTHTLSLFFSCERRSHELLTPSSPDPTQTGIKWVALSDLHTIVLYPKIQDRIIRYVNEGFREDFIEEADLAKS
ncbi:NUDIX domain-containing protein [Bacillus sp. KH172YL63]|uniref:NUDIX domain-containing protein n=1 Tax=Bacillus sp. KH172YL63 TaxID=2709784 RepID=UPI0013E46F4A|nr:NUDIX domain-containing protein [Bacillus sp. KH172YL63]BCB04333.1 DNA mismatch repair protein MutT [Bacillus sp. KH172YL63]